MHTRLFVAVLAATLLAATLRGVAADVVVSLGDSAHESSRLPPTVHAASRGGDMTDSAESARGAHGERAQKMRSITLGLVTPVYATQRTGPPANFTVSLLRVFGRDVGNPTGGGLVEPLAGIDESVLDMSFSDNSLFYSTAHGIRSVELNSSGDATGPPVKVLNVTGVAHGLAAHANEQYIVFGKTDGVYVWDRVANNVTKLGSYDQAPRHMALDSSLGLLFFTGHDGVYRADVRTGMTQRIRGGDFLGIAGDDFNDALFFTEPDQGNVWRCRRDGSDPLLVVTLGRPQVVTYDDEKAVLYVSDALSGGFYRFYSNGETLQEMPFHAGLPQAVRFSWRAPPPELPSMLDPPSQVFTSSQALSLAWEPPRSDGFGGNAGALTYTLYMDGAEHSTVLGVTGTVVSGLEANRTYAFAVRCANGLGAGTRSAVSSIRTRLTSQHFVPGVYVGTATGTDAAMRIGVFDVASGTAHSSPVSNVRVADAVVNVAANEYVMLVEESMVTPPGHGGGTHQAMRLEAYSYASNNHNLHDPKWVWSCTLPWPEVSCFALDMFSDYVFVNAGGELFRVHMHDCAIDTRWAVMTTVPAHASQCLYLASSSLLVLPVSREGLYVVDVLQSRVYEHLMPKELADADIVARADQYGSQLMLRAQVGERMDEPNDVQLWKFAPNAVEQFTKLDWGAKTWPSPWFQVHWGPDANDPMFFDMDAQGGSSFYALDGTLRYLGVALTQLCDAPPCSLSGGAYDPTFHGLGFLPAVVHKKSPLHGTPLVLAAVGSILGVVALTIVASWVAGKRRGGRMYDDTSSEEGDEEHGSSAGGSVNSHRYARMGE